MADKIKAGVIGATGYAGVELVRLIGNHPNMELTAVSSVSFEGKKLSDIYPAFYGIYDQELVGTDAVVSSCDLVFTSVPAGVSEELAEACVAKGARMIDMGADFRLKNEADYREWYKGEYRNKALHAEAVYCIPELHRSRITKDTRIIGNPGCYPTSIALGLAPVLSAKLAVPSGIVIDSKSGTSGSGRGLTQTTHFPECDEAFSAYKVAAHRHTPEIEQTIRELTGESAAVSFVPHLLPLIRGILSTLYIPLKENTTIEELHALYREFYSGETFVRVMPLGQTANLKQVRLSNYCDLSLHYDARTNRLIVVSVIDNMVKGAAGQAIQNANLLFGFPEKTGIDMVPPAI